MSFTRLSFLKRKILNGYKMNNDGKREGKLINCELTITNEKGWHLYRSLGVRRTAYKRP